MSDEIESKIIIKNLDKNTKFQNAVRSYFNKNQVPFTRSYFHDGWFYDMSLINKVNNDDIIQNVVKVYAKWVKDIMLPTCDIEVTDPLTAKISDDSGKILGNWITGGSSLSNGKHVYMFSDYAGNTSSCEINLVDQLSRTETYTCNCCGYNEPVSCGSSSDEWYGDGAWAGDSCYVTVWKECEQTRTVYYCPEGYDGPENEKCYITNK